tara:strand:+ start:2726 stop:2902 length:177 start_codon:yes stop_codon:yes gene_type:complete
LNTETQNQTVLEDILKKKIKKQEKANKIDGVVLFLLSFIFKISKILKFIVLPSVETRV